MSMEDVKVVKLICETGEEAILPVEIENGIEIQKNIRWNDTSGDGNSSLSREYQGYEPASITINFSLYDDEDSGVTAIEKAEKLNKLFTKLVNSRPAVWKIVDVHTRARGIKQVQVSSFRTREVEDGIEAVLELIEYIPPELNKEKKTAQAETTASQDQKTKTCTEQNTSEYCRELLVKWEKEKMEGKTQLSFAEWAKQKPLPPSADTDNPVVNA